MIKIAHNMALKNIPFLFLPVYLKPEDMEQKWD
jgi:hypothetical protein